VSYVSGNPTIEEQELLATVRKSPGARMSRRELAVVGLVSGGFVLGVAGLWWLRPPDGLPSTGAVLSLIVLIVAMRVSFETPFGFTVATQLAFVPLVFTLSPALVPIAVVLAWLASGLPELVTGRLRPVKLLRAPANASFAIGPAFVFAVAATTPGHAGAALLLLALIAQFAGDFVVSAAVFRITERANIRSQLRDCWVYMIDAALSGIGFVVAAEMGNGRPLAVLAVLPLLGLLAMFAQERNRRLTGLLELNDTYHGTAMLLGDVIAADDGYTGEHSAGVVALALAVGDRLHLDARRRRNLQFAALLHDVGKIAIPKEIINKPGKLDAAEWELIKTHTVKGQAMLERVGGFMLEVGGIVRSHHERWDGKGYPDGLVADRTPLEARIVSCCDAWNAMRTDRSYRKALPYATAVSQMHENTGTQFDPAVVRALLATVSDDSAARADRDPVDRSALDPPAPSVSAPGVRTLVTTT
jgi:HD-GYP domain-containing protein (c-di-GMP phosphodiesterase class II)